MTYNTEVLDCLVSRLLEQQVFLMEISMIKDIVSKLARICLVSLLTFLQERLLEFLETWNELLVTIPIFGDVNKSIKSLTEHQFSHYWILKKVHFKAFVRQLLKRENFQSKGSTINDVMIRNKFI